MTKKLIYFDVKGLGEPIRYILKFGGIDFEDVRIQPSEYLSQKEKLPDSFGKLPLFVDGDRVLNQSVAITRYIGRLLDLVPTDPWEEAAVDAVILTLQDFSAVFYRGYVYEADATKKIVRRKELIEETIPFYFSKFDKIIKNNNGHIGKELTWADFFFVARLQSIDEHFSGKISETYPSIKALANTIFNLPGVKEHIAARKN